MQGGRRQALLAALLLGSGAAAQDKAPPARLGIVTLLGDSVRIAARELQEVRFREVGMDDIVFTVVGRALQGGWPRTELRHFRAPAQVSVEDQLAIGTAAARRAELPAWVAEAAREAALSHVLLVGCHTGRMELRTGATEVVGTDRGTGVGFIVSASGRTRNEATGAVSSGYLAPFVHLRLTLIELAGPSVVQTVRVNDGFIVGSTVAEAPDPWRFITLEEKADALRALLRETLARGAAQVLAAAR